MGTSTNSDNINWSISDTNMVTRSELFLFDLNLKLRQGGQTLKPTLQNNASDIHLYILISDICISEILFGLGMKL